MPVLRSSLSTVLLAITGLGVAVASATPSAQACSPPLLLTPLLVAADGQVVFELQCGDGVACPTPGELQLKRTGYDVPLPGVFELRELPDAGARIMVFKPETPLFESQIDNYVVQRNAFTVGNLTKPLLPAAVAPLTTIATALKDRVGDDGERYFCYAEGRSGCDGSVHQSYLSWGARGVRVPTLEVKVGREPGWLFAAYAQSQPRPAGLVFRSWAQISVDLREGEQGCATVEAVHVLTAQRETRTVCETAPTYSDAERIAVPTPNLGACQALPRQIDTGRDATELLEPWCNLRRAACANWPSPCALDARCSPPAVGDDEPEPADADAADLPGGDLETDTSTGDDGCSVGRRSHGGAWLLALLLGWLPLRSRGSRRLRCVDRT